MSLALALHLLSMVFQLAAAILALRLIGISGRKLAWIVLSLSFAVRLLRLIVQTVLFFFGEYRLFVVEEAFSLAVSILAFAGVLLIRPIFLTYRQTEQARETLLREVEAARKREEAEHRHLRTVLETLPVAVWITDPKGKIVEANKMVDKIFGAPPDSERMQEYGLHHGWRIEDGSAVPPEEWPMNRAVDRGETVLGERYEISRFDGARAIVILSAVPLQEAGKVFGGVAVAQDITELHRLQKEKEEYNYTISHDLRTPLTVILGHAQLLQERLKQRGINDELLLSVDAIEKGADRMHAMISSLTESARLESGQIKAELQSVELDAYLDNLLKRCAIALQIERIRTDILGEIPPVLADPILLERIILNLLTNALKYSSDGTEVRLTVRAEEKEAVVCVCDNGPGIDREELSHLFTRFYRTGGGREKEGLGLGLYICRKLAEVQKGRIWAESTKGQGSKFCVAIPYADTGEDR
jgi:signal transduction histidine kinase